MKVLNVIGLFAAGLVIGIGSPVSGENLTATVKMVIETNPQIQSSLHRRLSIDGEVVQAKSGYLPTLDVSAAAGYGDYREPVDDELQPREAVISLRQNLFTGFATMNEVGRQQARLKSSAYSLQSTVESLALSTAQVYLNVLRGEELKQVARENLDTHLNIMEQIRLRSKSGVGSQADTDQASGRVSLAQSNLVIAQTNLIDAYTAYQAVVGLLPDETLARPDAPDSLMPSSLADAERLAVENHPTLKSAVADLRAREEQYEVAKSPYYPVLDLEVDQRWDEDVSRTEGKRDHLIAMARIRMNLFNGWKDKGRKAQTFEQVIEAREIKNNTQRQVVEAMRLSWMAYQSVVDRIKYLQEHIDSSRATADSYAKQFDIGRRTLLDVLDTEAEAINARIDMINASYDGLIAQYRVLNTMGSLVRALGLEWPEESVVVQKSESGESEVSVN